MSGRVDYLLACNTQHQRSPVGFFSIEPSAALGHGSNFTEAAGRIRWLGNMKAAFISRIRHV